MYDGGSELERQVMPMCIRCTLTKGAFFVNRSGIGIDD
ncbi:hypothetical protein EFDM72_2323 [Enterococcus faecalis]|nr:hypothetical protein EFDM72_2323 [Enterococcus faecalis]